MPSERNLRPGCLLPASQHPAHTAVRPETHPTTATTADGKKCTKRKTKNEQQGMHAWMDGTRPTKKQQRTPPPLSGQKHPPQTKKNTHHFSLLPLLFLALGEKKKKRKDDCLTACLAQRSLREKVEQKNTRPTTSDFFFLARQVADTWSLFSTRPFPIALVMFWSCTPLLFLSPAPLAHILHYD